MYHDQFGKPICPSFNIAQMCQKMCIRWKTKTSTYIFSYFGWISKYCQVLDWLKSLVKVFTAYTVHIHRKTSLRQVGNVCIAKKKSLKGQLNVQ